MSGRPTGLHLPRRQGGEPFRGSLLGSSVIVLYEYVHTYDAVTIHAPANPVIRPDGKETGKANGKVAAAGGNAIVPLSLNEQAPSVLVIIRGLVRLPAVALTRQAHWPITAVRAAAARCPGPSSL